MDYCETPNIKIISGNRICIKCDINHGPHIIHSWIDWDPRKCVKQKSIYTRTLHVKNKLKHLKLSSNELQAFMEIWVIVEAGLKEYTWRRFPKLEFFINKILKNLDIDKQFLYKISDELQERYEFIWNQIV